MNPDAPRIIYRMLAQMGYCIYERDASARRVKDIRITIDTECILAFQEACRYLERMGYVTPIDTVSRCYVLTEPGKDALEFADYEKKNKEER